MFLLKVNRKHIPLKMSYFLMFSCFGPMVGFLPTIAKQLGYSLTTFGAIMTFMSLITMILVPTTGIIVDKFPVKNKLFTLSALGFGGVSFLFLFVPKVHLDTVATLKCDTESSETLFVIYTENDLRKTKNQAIFNRTNTDELIRCQMKCQDTNINHKLINKSIQESDFLQDWMIVNGTTNLKRYDQIGVTLKFNRTEINENSYYFHVLTVDINNTQLPSTTCIYSSETVCHINCSNDDIMNIATSKTIRENVLNLYQFWIFFALVTGLWASSGIYSAILNPVCLNILEDKAEDFGKQKCWGSIGWGVSSIFFGWFVDLISMQKKEKDYTPIFYANIIFTICTVVILTKLEIVETKKTENKRNSVLGLLSKYYVVLFFIWAAINTIFHTIITHFLFWYMEDMVSGSNDPAARTWIKTLQGLAQGVQCFGGEIPFFFWSGWIINKLGHVQCMALIMGAMALRLFLYTVISNPAWIILIELLNGISYALCFSVKMAFAKIISPPDTISTVVGFIGLCDCLGESMGSLLGGYLFDTYGGVWTFRFFASCSAFICCVNIITNSLGLTKNLKNSNDKTISTETHAQENVITDKQL